MPIPTIFVYKTQLTKLLLLITSLFFISQSLADVSISIDKGLVNKSFTGKVYVIIAPVKKDSMPLQTNYWFLPIEIISKEVKDWDGKSAILINRNDTRYIKETSADDVNYELQVLIRVNKRNADPFSSPGNIYSAPIALTSSAHKSLDLSVVATKVIDQDSPLQKSKPPETEQLKLFSRQSQLLSEFFEQDYSVNVAVRLPKEWASNSEKKWPVLYYISGMGGNELEFLRLVKGREAYFDKMITVSVDAMNYGGHSVFADSANTGPWASMLLNEIIPHVDSTYRGVGAEQRYLTGISSGGWSSLWLQVKYPTDFSGVWSFVPDPVDFRDFQRINLYSSNQNFYVDSLGEDRLVARTSKGKVLIKSRDFISLETALGEGGQIRSFEYVFSPRGEDGMPIDFFDRQTGEINRQVIEAWKPYDIRLYLKKNWSIIKDNLSGKLNIYGGEKDNFFLEGAVRLLKEQLVYLDAKEDVEVISGLGHAFDQEKVEEMLKVIVGSESVKQ
ncbi:MAG: hypothetical protein COA74_14490 [Gammaproteobacteria bacterium]|nr:MAG: hypothetical protein COA74_14490 [Gammaproteobacteria bacterium]